MAPLSCARGANALAQTAWQGHPYPHPALPLSLSTWCLPAGPSTRAHTGRGRAYLSMSALENVLHAGFSAYTQYEVAVPLEMVGSRVLPTRDSLLHPAHSASEGDSLEAHAHALS